MPDAIAADSDATWAWSVDELASDVRPVLVQLARSNVRNEQPTGVPFTFPVGSSHCTPHGGAVREAVAITKKLRFTGTVRGGAIW